MEDLEGLSCNGCIRMFAIAATQERMISYARS
jgi:hypothetical protein